MAENKNYFGPIRGVVYDKGKTQTFPTPRGEFSVRVIKVEFKEQGRDGKMYSTIPELKLMNDNCNVVDYGGYEVGKEVDVWFSLNGREMKWNDKQTGQPKSAWKTEITCVKIKAVRDVKEEYGVSTSMKDIGIPAENQAIMDKVIGDKTATLPDTFVGGVGGEEIEELPF